MDPADGAPVEDERWLTPGVRGIGAASLFSDLGHEVPTALLPGFLTSTLGAPAAALGLIEGVADGIAGAAKLAGGALADDPRRRGAVAVGGYTATAILSSLDGVATSAWQVGVLRGGAWAARGLRSPSRNALLADLVPSRAYGRAYGIERAMDTLGAIGGPLLALGLVTFVGVRTSILLSVIPGLLAAVAMALAARHVVRPSTRERRPIRLRVRPVLRGRLGRLMAGIGAFELGNVAATLLILRATELLEPSRGRDSATRAALLLYTAYNLAATLVSIPAGHLGDRRGNVLALALGVACFAGAYAGLAFTGPDLILLAALFALAGAAIGLAETAETAAVATFAAEEVRGSAFGLLAGVQSFGNLAASAVAGGLWTAASPRVAFLYAAALMALSLAAITVAAARDASRSP
jgi:MFS family permease